MKKYIKEYQCRGCVNGPYELGCFKKTEFSESCDNHVIGTTILQYGKILLGMPKGFNIVGPIDLSSFEYKPHIFKNHEDFIKSFNKPNFLNIPVWAWKNEENHTFIKLLSPRTNIINLVVILEDCIDQFKCYQLTKEDLASID